MKSKLLVIGSFLLLTIATAGCSFQIKEEQTTVQPASVTVSASKITTTETTAEVTTEPTTEPDVNDDLLLLVNYKYPLPDNYKPKLIGSEFHQKIDKRAEDPLNRMLAACRNAGCKPLLCSGYRTFAKQTELYNNKVREYKNKGLSKEDAEKEAVKWVAYPGTSEHHTGLAVDIVDVNYQILDEKQEQTKTQQWLIENCWKYGFILRYPTDKKAITHINYEPWHYRYVGKENARKIYDSGLCLEEYLNKK